jgi:hypothetical protein
MNITTQLSGEDLDHKLAVVFDSESSARNIAEILRNALRLGWHQIHVIGPNDRHPGFELEPEDRGIWRTMVRAHVWLGIAGAIGGLLLFAVLFFVGIEFVVANAFTTAVIAVAFGGIFGLMFGGLVTLRPDHMPYISMAQSALRKGKYVLAVHASSADQLAAAKAELHKMNLETITSL